MHVVVIDSNDERGINVGVLSRYPIASIRTYVDDKYKSTNGQTYKIFICDCAEYSIDIGNGKTVHFLCNHLKSKGYGSPAYNNANRKRQANRLVEILQSYVLTTDLVVIAGDFNDTPNSAPLKNLMAFPNLVDVLKNVTPNRTYHTGSEQIDYLLVSKAIADNLKSVGIERRGIFRANNTPFPEVTNKVTQASDHAAVFAQFEV